MRTTCLSLGLLAMLICMATPLSADDGEPQNRKFDVFPAAHPAPGDMAPDFTLKTVDGEPFTLSEAYAEQPVVIEFGLYT